MADIEIVQSIDLTYQKFFCLLLLCCCRSWQALKNRFYSIHSFFYLVRKAIHRKFLYVTTSKSSKGKAMKRNGLFYIVLNEKQIFTSLAITSLTSSTELQISTTEWTVFLKYLVTKSRSLVNADGRELNLIPSVTRELALYYARVLWIKCKLSNKVMFKILILAHETSR